ncbi:potassium channel family protein [Butyrivibrio sp. NC3005]|uniref:potassium channel family protein n=1 Tax=Butyrivibrio sp. NC3005 TaxID=1280685 RepID=UPI00041BC286|nr:TrkA family potassium uptake protein [Butyrivibrio sp. NC3005]
MKKSIAVLGLGRFGKSVITELHECGADLLIADDDEEMIQQYADMASYAVSADLSDPEAIKKLGIGNMDAVVVSMGSSLEASIMCVMVAKELGVPKIIAKVSSERMGEVLVKIGATSIIYPEQESAYRMAHRLTSDNFLEMFDIDENLCIVHMKVKKEWVGKNLIELNFRSKYDANVVAIKEKEQMISHIDPKRPLSIDAELLIVADRKVVQELED